MAVVASDVNPQILPTPLLCWRNGGIPAALEVYDPAKSSYLAWIFSGELIHDAYASLYRVVTGFLVGAVLALPLGLMMARTIASISCSIR